MASLAIQHAPRGLLRGLGEVLHRARAARGDDGRVGDRADLADERQVVAGAHAVGGLRGGEDAGDAEVVDLLRPLDRVLARRRAAAVDVDLVARGHRRVLVQSTS